METDGALDSPELGNELFGLKKIFPAGVDRLVYAWTGDPSRPLEVRLLRAD